jgi:hypothetical protein
LAKAVQTSPVVTSAEHKPVTLRSLEDLYDAVHKFDKQAGCEKAFFEKFGSRKVWLGQFKRQSYDGGV